MLRARKTGQRGGTEGSGRVRAGREGKEAAAAIEVREEDGLKEAEAVRLDKTEVPRGQEGKLVRFAS